MFWSGASAFDCDGSLIDWKSCIFSALHSLIAAHHKTLSDDALDELYAEQADLIFDRPEICGCLYRRAKTSSRGESVTSAAEAVDENKPDIAAVNRCATRNQVQRRVFPRAVTTLASGRARHRGSDLPVGPSPALPRAFGPYGQAARAKSLAFVVN
jgi:phosphoglycolate phosphatase-like HAD superfamily hydrolase